MPDPALPRLVAPSLLLALLLGGCQPADTRARQVAQGFWEALRSGDTATARRLTRGASQASLEEMTHRHPIEEVQTGNVEREEGTARVETILRVAGRQIPISFDTYLEQAGDGWKVDLPPTQRELTRASLAGSLEEVSHALRETAGALSQEIEKEALEASEAVREALEDLQQRLGVNPPPGGSPTP